MKRVLIDANPVVPYFVSGRVSGIGRTTMELIQALAQIPDLPFEIMLYSQNLKGIGGKSIDVPFKTRHLYLPNRERINKILSHFPAREILTGYDIMHITHNFEYVHQPERCIATIHDALFMKIEETAFNHAQMKKEVPLFAKKCQHIITCSEASKKDICETMQVDPNKITVIYWGYNKNIFYPSSLTKHEIVQSLRMYYPHMPFRYFLSVSCNAERKRTHLLVDSYIRFCSNNPVNDLVLVWNNPPEWLLQKVEKSKAAHKIHFLTNVSDENLALLYNGATASITPSSYEGFGLPVLEAMACGTPVGTCNNSSLPEIGGDAAVYINEPVEDSLLTLFENFENNLIPTDSLISKGLMRATNFSWERCSNETVEVYKRNLGL